MQLQINYGDLQISSALTDHVARSIGHALKHAAGNITRVEVHLRDDKQKRHGPKDKRCTLEARVAGAKPLDVEARGDDIYHVVSSATEKLDRAVNRKLERRRERKR